MNAARIPDVAVATPWLDSSLDAMRDERAAPLASLEWCLQRATALPGAPGEWREWLLQFVPGGAELLASHRPGPTLRELAARDSRARLSPAPGFEPRSWACARPVHLRAASDHVWLEPDLEPPLAATESAELVATLNVTLADSGCALVALDERRWLLASREPIDCQTWSPEESSGRAIRTALPAGPDARRVRRLMNELQIVLHAHAGNERRALHGQQTANAVWLWGFGAPAAVRFDRGPLPRLASDDDWLRDVWQLHGARVDSPATLLRERSTAERPLLIAMTSPGSRNATSEDLIATESQLFVPLREASISGRIRCVEWLTGDAIRRLAASGPWSGWRRWLAAVKQR